MWEAEEGRHGLSEASQHAYWRRHCPFFSTKSRPSLISMHNHLTAFKPLAAIVHFHYNSSSVQYPQTASLF